MSDQEGGTAAAPRDLRILAPLGQWIPDAKGKEVYYKAGTVLPETAWPSSPRALNAMIRAGDLEVVKREPPPESEGK